MTIQATYIGSIEARDTAVLTTTAKTSILDGEAQLIIMASVNLVNISGSAVIVSLYRHDGTSDHRFWRGSVPANDTMTIDVPVPLAMASHEVRAEASTGNAIEVYPFVLRQSSFGPA